MLHVSIERRQPVLRSCRWRWQFARQRQRPGIVQAGLQAILAGIGTSDIQIRVRVVLVIDGPSRVQETHGFELGEYVRDVLDVAKVLARVE